MLYQRIEGGNRTELTMHHSGKCDLCNVENCKTIYDARIPSIGIWANMCEKCAKKNSIRLGIGSGQKYELIEE